MNHLVNWVPPRARVGRTRAAGTILAIVTGAGSTFGLTGCGPSDTPTTAPTLDGPSPIATGPQVPGTPKSPEQSKQQEQLQIAGDWNCMMKTSKGPDGISFTIVKSNGQWRMERHGANDPTTGEPATIVRPLTITGDTISWAGDTGNNPSGWDVTIFLHNNSIDGAMGQYLNHFNNQTRPITDCMPLGEYIG